MPFAARMPLRMSTVPELLRGKPLGKVVVPALADLRNVPALSNRQVPIGANVAAFWAWNNAPGRLVMTPLSRMKGPAPVQIAVPPFSKVLCRLTPFALPTWSVAPGEMVIRPLPSIVPNGQFITLAIVTVPVPRNMLLP